MNPDQYSSVVSSFTVKEDTTWGVWTPLKKVVDSSLAGGCKPDSTLAKWGIVDSALGAGGYAGRKASPSGLRFSQAGPSQKNKKSDQKSGTKFAMPTPTRTFV